MMIKPAPDLPGAILRLAEFGADTRKLFTAKVVNQFFFHYVHNIGNFKTPRRISRDPPAMLRTRPQRWRVATAGWVAMRASETQPSTFRKIPLMEGHALADARAGFVVSVFLDTFSSDNNLKFQFAQAFGQ